MSLILSSHSPSQTNKQQVTRILEDGESFQSDFAPWSVLDMEKQGIVNLTPAIFAYIHITGLYLAHNALRAVPAGIAALTRLQILDLSHNRIRLLPPDITRLTALSELLLSNNDLTELPVQLARITSLSIITVDNNPLPEPIVTASYSGSDAVLSLLLDSCPVPPAPAERAWVRPAVIPLPTRSDGT